MIVRKLRLQRAWSQEQLAQMSGLSIRTIQRIERGHNAGLESLKSLAAVFEISLTQLKQEQDMTTQINTEAAEDTSTQQTVTMEEKEAIEYVRDLKDFYAHLFSFVTFIPLLFLINWLTSPGYYWAWWAVLGWGVSLASHALSVFEIVNVKDSHWEKKQIEKRLGRKL